VGLFGGIKKVIDWNKFGLKLDRAKDAIEKEQEMQGYDVQKSILKGLKGLALVALTMAAASILTQFADSTFVDHQLEAAGVSHMVATALAGVIAYAAEHGRNWLKNRDKVAVPPTSVQD
jgi:hypothetical protein